MYVDVFFLFLLHFRFPDVPLCITNLYSLDMYKKISFIHKISFEWCSCIWYDYHIISHCILRTSLSYWITGLFTLRLWVRMPQVTGALNFYQDWLGLSVFVLRIGASICPSPSVKTDQNDRANNAESGDTLIVHENLNNPQNVNIDEWTTKIRSRQFLKCL